MTDYTKCPHCGGDIYGLYPQIEEYKVALEVGCGRPWCKVKFKQTTLLEGK